MSLNSDFDSKLMEINNYFSDVLRPIHDIFIVNILEINNNIEIRITVIQKTTLQRDHSTENDRLYGVYDYNGIDVLVYGIKSNLLFSKTTNLESLSYLKNRMIKNDINDDKSKVVAIYEPIVWKYKYNLERKEIKHLKTGYYRIF